MQDLDDRFFEKIATNLNMELLSWKKVLLDSSGGVVSCLLGLDTTTESRLKGIYGFELNGIMKSDIQDGVRSDHDVCNKISKETHAIKVTLKIKVPGKEVHGGFAESVRHRGQDFVEAFRTYFPIVLGIYNSHTLEIRLMQRLVNNISSG